MRRAFVYVLLAAVLAGLTSARVRVYVEGERALWLEATHASPHKPKPFINLGNVFARDGHVGLAETMYRTADDLAQHPGRLPDEVVFGRGFAAANLAILTFQAGDVPAARAILLAAMTRRPTPTILPRLLTWMDDPSVAP